MHTWLKVRRWTSAAAAGVEAGAGCAAARAATASGRHRRPQPARSSSSGQTLRDTERLAAPPQAAPPRLYTQQRHLPASTPTAAPASSHPSAAARPAGARRSAAPAEDGRPAAPPPSRASPGVLSPAVRTAACAGPAARAAATAARASARAALLQQEVSGSRPAAVAAAAAGGGRGQRRRRPAPARGGGPWCEAVPWCGVVRSVHRLALRGPPARRWRRPRTRPHGCAHDQRRDSSAARAARGGCHRSAGAVQTRSSFCSFTFAFFACAGCAFHA